MMLPFFEVLYNEFHTLHDEIKNALDTLPPEAMDWKPTADMNTVSVIIAHLTGAERFLVGDVVTGDPSNRNRDAEFAVMGLSRQDLFDHLNLTEAYLKGALEKLTLADLDTTCLHPHRGSQVSVAWALVHALDHDAVHLGQLQITVQLWQQRPVVEG